MNKVTIIGAGHVGSSVASTILDKNLADELALIDLNQGLALGEIMDLKDSSYITYPDKILKVGTYDDVKDSSFVVITAGLSQANANNKEGRMNGLAKCVAIITSIIKELKNRNYDGFIIIASNPLDIMTYYSYKLSGLSTNKVIGTGTLLDSTRLRIILASKLNVSVSDIDAYSLGEHGNTQFMCSSLATVREVPLKEYLKTSLHMSDTTSYLDEIESQVKRYGFEILERKGGTYYGVASAVARIIKAIINNEKVVLPVCTYVNDEYGIKDTYISVPATISKEGAVALKDVKLSSEELKKLQDSANFIKSSISI
jgi:L-lactate dehydrogenase